MIRVLIADNDGIARTGLRMILEAAEGVEVVAETVNGGAAVEAVRRHWPTVVLMDVGPPRTDGLTALNELQLLPRPPRVIMLTSLDSDEYVHRALRSGAAGFLLKDITPGELVTAVRVVAAGSSVLAPSVTKRLIEAFTARPAPDVYAARQRFAVLTARERTVAAAVARGLANAAIARELGMTETTVKAHVSRALTKLGMSNRVQIALLARDTLEWPNTVPQQRFRLPVDSERAR
ncbi:response regulator transcription factor [Nocardia wallacei]|uniref:response regulator transcription factor n=1 Tax=Nocardia wallacei TaxID=480035 RepID=UPI00245562B6|nr:response regulator transcription factor [Nocardia wallacei]